MHANDDTPLPDGQRRIHRFGQPPTDRWPRLEPIDHDFDVVPHLPIERQVVRERDNAAIHTGPHEALLPQILEQILVLALLAANDGRKHGELRTGGQHQNTGDDLLARLGGDRPAALGAMPVTNSRIQHP